MNTPNRTPNENTQSAEAIAKNKGIDSKRQTDDKAAADTAAEKARQNR